MLMNNEKLSKAIDGLKLRLCCERPVAHYCRDICLENPDLCDVAVAIEAVETLQKLILLMAQEKSTFYRRYIEDQTRFGLFSDITIDDRARWLECDTLLEAVTDSNRLQNLLSTEFKEDE